MGMEVFKDLKERNETLSTIELVRAEKVEEQADNTQPWLTLQQEIRDRLIQLKKLTALGVTGGLEESLEEVNRKVAKYNELVPSSQMQKTELTRDTFVAQLSFWE